MRAWCENVAAALIFAQFSYNINSIISKHCNFEQNVFFFARFRFPFTISIIDRQNVTTKIHLRPQFNGDNGVQMWIGTEMYTLNHNLVFCNSGKCECVGPLWACFVTFAFWKQLKFGLHTNAAKEKSQNIHSKIKLNKSFRFCCCAVVAAAGCCMWACRCCFNAVSAFVLKLK